MQARKKKLVRNDIQLKLALLFALSTSMALVLQFMLFLATMTGRGLDERGLGRAHAEIVEATLVTLALSVLIVLPLMLLVGVLATHRYAGPIFAFRGFLEALTRGERPEDLRLRKHDELKDVCDLLNRATAPLRRRDAPRADARETA
jgi:hypothetical protein